MMVRKPSRARQIRTTVREIASEMRAQTEKAELFTVASSLAYTTIVSVIPLMALSLAIFQAFGGMEKFYDQLRPFIIDNLAEGVSADVAQKIGNFVTNAHANAFGIGGLIGVIITGMSMLASVEKAINRIWEVKDRRSFIRRILRYSYFVTVGPLALSALIALGSRGTIPWHRLLPSGPGTFLILVAVFFAIYQWVPAHRVKPKYALIAASAAAFTWTLARLLYIVYTTHVVSYNKIYGSLGAIPILLLWIYIGWLVVLFGAALSAILQRGTYALPQYRKRLAKP